MQILNLDGTKLAEWEYRYTPKTPKNVYFKEKTSLTQKLKDTWYRFNSFNKMLWEIKYLFFLITPVKNKIVKTTKDKVVWKLVNPHPNYVSFKNNENIKHVYYL